MGPSAGDGRSVLMMAGSRKGEIMLYFEQKTDPQISIKESRKFVKKLFGLCKAFPKDGTPEFIHIYYKDELIQVRANGRITRTRLVWEEDDPELLKKAVSKARKAVEGGAL